MATQRDSVDRRDTHCQHRGRQKSPTALCGNCNRRQRNHHQINREEPQVHRHRPARIFQSRTRHLAGVRHHDNCRHQHDVHRRRSEHPGESMPQPGLARHTLDVAPMGPGHCAGIPGGQEECRHRLERPGQPLSPGLVDERVLPTEISVVIGHRSGQPMAQHDEDHPRHAVKVHGQIADRALGHNQKSTRHATSCGQAYLAPADRARSSSGSRSDSFQ